MTEFERGDGSFEWLRERLPALAPAAGDDQRNLLWVDAARTLAVSRDAVGRLEMFIPGPEVAASIRAVRDSLSHQSWWLSNGDQLDANRIQFPSAPFLDGVVAFLCAELLENGASTDLAGSFERSEPAIAIALDRAALGNEVLVGLVGELLLMEALTRHVPDEADVVVAAWAGSVPSARDFRLGSTGVEVKATTGTASKHHVQGLHQIEPGYADGGAPETSLRILSLGIRWVEAGDGGTTIPDLVDRVLARLSPDETDLFLMRLGQYGGDAGSGYQHSRDRFRTTYSRPFTTRFERLYDMGDPTIRLPRRGDLETFGELDIDSLSFRVDLPAQVRGDLNPVTGWAGILRALAQTMHDS